MGTSADAPFVDSVYKLVEFDGRPVLKLSTDKVTAPGAKQVFRRAGFAGDIVGLRGEEPPDGAEPLLVPVMRDGRRVGARGALEAARARFEADLASLPAAATAIRGPVAPAPETSAGLAALTERVRRQIASGGGSGRTGSGNPRSG
jgi:nicotinate phosphoribosyltransferase